MIKPRTTKAIDMAKRKVSATDVKYMNAQNEWVKSGYIHQTHEEKMKEAASQHMDDNWYVPLDVALQILKEK